MGMYDDLKINVTQLPISSEEMELIQSKTFQTKSLEKALLLYEITEDNKLRYFFNEEWIYEDYHGYIEFYTEVNGVWFDFKAKFTDGTCVSIIRETE